VAAKLAKAISDREGGLAFDAKNLMLGEYLDLWLEDSVKDTVRLTTYQGYERIVRLHIKPTLGRVKLDILTPAHLRGLYRDRLEAGLAPRMVQLVHTTLHKALKQAVADGLVPRNVAGAVKAPQPPGKETKPLAPEQARALLKAAREDRLETLYVLAVTTGMRQGEFLGLKWDDVDLETGTIQVPAYALHDDGRWIPLHRPKDGQGSAQHQATGVGPLLSEEALRDTAGGER
jgi:integrase